MKIEHYGKDLDGVSIATLGELGFAYMKKFGATNVLAEPGKPQGFEETGSVSRDIPGVEHHRPVFDRVEPHVRDGRRQPHRGRPSRLHRSTRRR